MKVKGKHVHRYTLRVPFFDVDSMRIVWHGHYVKYLEEARCDWLRVLGYTYDAIRDDDMIWPIVKLELKYVRPARFDQFLAVEVRLLEYESSLRLGYRICDQESGETLCEASTLQMVVRASDQVTLYETPAHWQALVRAALEKSDG